MLIKKSLQYEVFPGSQPSRYYPRPTGFDFGDRTSPGFFPCGMIVARDVRKYLPYCRSQRKHGQPSTITNHVQFLTKYSKRLKDKPLSKHYRVNLDLDDLEKARYPQMTQSLTERVLMFSLCCYRRQETFVNLGLFQTISNYSWFLCLCLVMAFHSILFLYTSSLISKKYRGDIVKSKQDVLIYNSTCM